MSRRLRRLFLPGPAGRLEALLLEPVTRVRGVAIVCHPHPLHGGTMHTKAVYRTARGLEADGFAVLRFNFRGVGHSDGTFDGGRGELEDARAAREFLGQEYGDVALVLGGFSFGSHVALRLAPGSPRVDALLAIGLPLAEYDFAFFSDRRTPLLVVVGKHDAFCPEETLRAFVTRQAPQATVHVVPGAGHLLTEDLPALQEHVRRFVVDAVP